jgi:hypothetical protein
LIARESRSSVGSFIAFEHTPMVQIWINSNTLEL